MNRLIAPAAFLMIILGVASFFAYSKPSSQSISSKQPSEILKPFTTYNQQLPLINIINSQGQEVSFQQIAKKYQLVNFISRECLHCQSLMSVCENYADKLKVAWIGVGNDIERERGSLKRYIKESDFYLDQSGTIYNQMKLSMPSSLYFKQGELRYYFPGAIEEKHLKALIEER